VDFADFRLVKFDSIHEYIERSFDDEWEHPVSEVLGGVKSIYTFDLLAETKQPHEQFDTYCVGGHITVLLFAGLFLCYFCYFIIILCLFLLFLKTNILFIMV